MKSKKLLTIAFVAICVMVCSFALVACGDEDSAPAKQNQTILAPTATAENINSTSITLTAVAAGQGATKYGYSTTNDATTVTNWQEAVEFTGLTVHTDYYFFAKYEGNDNYNEAVSEGAKISTVCTKDKVYLTFSSLSGNIYAKLNNVALASGTKIVVPIGTFTTDADGKFANEAVADFVYTYGHSTYQAGAVFHYDANTNTYTYCNDGCNA